MRHIFPLAVALGLLLPVLQQPAQAVTTNEEQRLIAVLQSDAAPKDKDAACAHLKRIGTDRAVPALAALLADEQLSHSARYALESMPSAKAGRALLGALAKTSGMTKVGVIQSLGARRETGAVSALGKLLTDRDTNVATAAATALGQIGGSKALKVLQAGAPKRAEAVHDAVVDGRLRCAYGLLASGSESKAFAAFQRLYDTEKEDHVRTAAYRGMIQASGKRALGLMTRAISGTDGASQTAALQLVHEVKDAQATPAFISLLRTALLAPLVRVALIGGLAQRGDPAAAGDIAALVDGGSPKVRVAAVTALGRLGDASMVPLLAGAATSSSADEQKAARLALVQLCRGGVTAALLRYLPESKPEVQVELARALGERGDKAAVPNLVDLARQESPSSKAALQALALLVEDSQVGMMVQFVVGARTEAGRANATEALNVACHSIRARRGGVNVEPLAQALATAAPEARVALLPVCSSLIDPQLRAALRAGVGASDPKVRAAAVRALCDTCDPELLPDVLKVACAAPEANFRTLAIRACVRLTTQEETIKLPVPERLAPLKAILATDPNADQKRLVVAGLAEIPDLEALKLSQPMLDDPPIQLEAAQAVTKLASGLTYAQRADATNALIRVLTVIANAEVRTNAEAALKSIQSGADYIMDWQVAGPFLKEGKEYKDLFDMAFPPELSGAKDVKWKVLEPGVEAKRPWVMDLLKPLGGEQRVAYARTWIYSEERRPAQLELGSDDGIKVWFNHQVAYTNNTWRGLTPGADKVQVTLNAGWNPLVLKVTQLNQGWAFCARVRRPDGSAMDGLKFSARPPKARRAP